MPAAVPWDLGNGADDGDQDDHNGDRNERDPSDHRYRPLSASRPPLHLTSGLYTRRALIGREGHAVRRATLYRGPVPRSAAVDSSGVAHPSALADRILTLQRSAGNTAVRRLLDGDVQSTGPTPLGEFPVRPDLHQVISELPVGPGLDQVTSELPVRPDLDQVAGTATTTELESARQELEAFRAGVFPPLRDHEPSSKIGRFDVELIPALLLLIVTVRVNLSFVSGQPPEPFPGMLGVTPEEYVWTPQEIATFRSRFLAEVGDFWSERFVIRSTREPQEVWGGTDIHTVVRVVEDPANPHFDATVHKYPPDAQATNAFVGPLVPGKPGTASLNSNIFRLETELDDPAFEKVPITKVHFRKGTTTLDARGRAELAPVVKRLQNEATTHVRLRGRASSDRKAGTTKEQGFRDNLRLSRGRSESVRQELLAQGIDDARIVVVNWGDAGTNVNEDNCRVDVTVGTHERGRVAFHEFGHMLGLGDEYGFSDLPGNRPGDPLRDKEYVKMVKEQTGVNLVRTADASIMSSGGTVRSWHYSAFLEALKKITAPNTDWSL